MSQREGFTGGFIAGAIFGGFVGALAGTLVATQRLPQSRDRSSFLADDDSAEPRVRKSKRRQIQPADGMELSRRTLEDKIAQLNDAIDEVRLSLGNVNSQKSNSEAEV